jgi:hypothetical protein
MPAFPPRQLVEIPGALLALLLLAPFTPAADRPEWKEFTPEGAGFTVLLPGEPTVRKLPEGGGRAEIKRPAVDGFSYHCSWLLKEVPPAGPEVARAYLLGMQEGSAKGVKGKVVASKEITLDGMPGREFVIDVAENQVIRCRAYAVGERLLDFQVWGKDREAVQSKDPEKFFGSIKLTKKPEPAPPGK